MKAQQTELEWQEMVTIDTLSYIEKELRGKSGIYVWGWFNEEQNFVPYYEFFGQRTFVLIPHLSFAHIKWKGNNVKDKIKRALVV